MTRMVAMALIFVSGSCATNAISSSTWCEELEADFTAPDMVVLPRNSVAIVNNDNLDEAIETLSTRSFQRLTRAQARRLADIFGFPVGDLYLARAGVRGGADIRLEQYLDNIRGQLWFGTTINRSNGHLYIEAFQLSGMMNPRNIAVVVSVPRPVTAVSVGCHAAR